MADGYGIGPWLAQFFATKLYPAVVFSVFICLAGMLIAIIANGAGFEGVLRRLTGAILPLVALVIMVASGNQTVKVVAAALATAFMWFQFGVGFLVGVLLLESSHWLLRTDSDGAAAVYAMLVSSLGTFMLWAIMAGAFSEFTVATLGFVIGGGLHVVFRGIPASPDSGT
jgi:hypothetical protein